jgi:LAO/AO transport system kinase
MAVDVDSLIGLDKRALGKAVTVFEDSRRGAVEQRKQLLAALAAHPDRREARFVGITGTPGSGKSTLIGELATRLVDGDSQRTVAVVAVDPSSHISGGALLGDRTRVRFPADEQRLFFRSQASDRELGGVSRTTFQVCRLLSHLFDRVFVETVGIGQSEIEVQHVADHVYLVLQPMGGDQIQFMKAGIMEIPDAFILNKCDEVEAARASYNALRATLSLSRPGDAAEPPIHRTSAVTGEGLDAVAAEIAEMADGARSIADKELYFFEKWVRDEYGRTGLRRLRGAEADGAKYLRTAGSFEDAQLAFGSLVCDLTND